MAKMVNGYQTTNAGQDEIYDYVQLEDLPKLSELTSEVQRLVQSSTWWEVYGKDLTVIFVAIVAVFPSLLLMKHDNILCVSLGVVLFGCCHSIFTVKGAHSASHGAFSSSPKLNKFLAIFFLELCGAFSEELGIDIHVKIHHPHTNIIGLGDSSTWKAPFLPRIVYMFLSPLVVPVITPFVAVAGLWKQWAKLLRYLQIASLGLAINFLLLVKVSGFSICGAIVSTLIARTVLSIPYIHVNIFQHIGLPMFSQSHRPKRIYQMSTGCLNLSRNPILDLCFGHSLISCHVEHHLFPKLSDNMCLKVKPVVSKFLKAKGLPYKEDSYMGRLRLFLDNYEKWMVMAPPITHFVGIQ